MQDTSTIGDKYEEDYELLSADLPDWTSDFRNDY